MISFYEHFEVNFPSFQMNAKEEKKCLIKSHILISTFMHLTSLTLFSIINYTRSYYERRKKLKIFPKKTSHNASNSSFAEKPKEKKNFFLASFSPHSSSAGSSLNRALIDTEA
ncbi:CLUMA_CG003223, isoform A [Clunio marinus]|uniref:CLUMA_CG003223, isoform A n=1 Tax=Clunio marinus TaxID=568069 RepID=A0A1J1HN57_9DIPT|nr:CLUMA_CG003223, isoform A [Clunio marinus]